MHKKSSFVSRSVTMNTLLRISEHALVSMLTLSWLVPVSIAGQTVFAEGTLGSPSLTLAASPAVDIGEFTTIGGLLLNLVMSPLVVLGLCGALISFGLERALNHQAVVKGDERSERRLGIVVYPTLYKAFFLTAIFYAILLILFPTQAVRRTTEFGDAVHSLILAGFLSIVVLRLVTALVFWKSKRNFSLLQTVRVLYHWSLGIWFGLLAIGVFRVLFRTIAYGPYEVYEPTRAEKFWSFFVNPITLLLMTAIAFTTGIFLYIHRLKYSHAKKNP